MRRSALAFIALGLAACGAPPTDASDVTAALAASTTPFCDQSWSTQIDRTTLRADRTDDQSGARDTIQIDLQGRDMFEWWRGHKNYESTNSVNLTASSTEFIAAAYNNGEVRLMRDPFPSTARERGNLRIEGSSSDRCYDHMIDVILNADGTAFDGDWSVFDVCHYRWPSNHFYTVHITIDPALCPGGHLAGDLIRRSAAR